MENPKAIYWLKPDKECSWKFMGHLDREANKNVHLPFTWTLAERADADDGQREWLTQLSGQEVFVFVQTVGPGDVGNSISVDSLIFRATHIRNDRKSTQLRLEATSDTQDTLRSLRS